MPVKIEPGSEPIPGYKLIERLGGGGFGEVWKAEAPGGLLKAMKFVYGELGSLDATADESDSNRAEQELKALSRIKSVRHSYILSLERFDIIDGQLIITTELADRTLWDRFRECRNLGLPGIPREELLNYIQETAEALDAMYEEYQLQHLDIKPQNLFLVYKHVKVADFGLVKDLGERGAATITGGVTPVYAAPETFDGWLSRYSDQYSLAIVYQELLTGQRPFGGSTMRQLVLQHLQGDPDLSALPAADKPVVGRALSKNPDDRFSTCLEFVKVLRSANAAGASVVAFSKPASTPRTTPPPIEENPEQQKTLFVRAKDRDAPLSPLADEPPGEVWERPAVLPPRPDSAAQADADTPKSQVLTGSTRPTNYLQARGQAPRIREQPAGSRILQPALVLGLGTLGGETIRQLRRILSQEVGGAEQLPVLRLLAIDTDPDALHKLSEGDAGQALQPLEMFHARLHRPGHYLKPREGKLPTDSWLNAKVVYRIPRHQNAAGMRPLGRLAFVDHYRTIYRRLEREIATCVDPDIIKEQLEQGELGVRATTPRIYLVACLAGNTGSGMFLDAAYVIRHLLRKSGFAHSDIIGLFFVPPVGQQGIRSPELANAYAALKELTYYATGQAPFSARYDSLDPAKPPQPFKEGGPPFQRSYLITLPEKAFGAEAALAGKVDLVAQFLYRELATPLGKAIDELRIGVLDPAQPLGHSSFQSFGIHRICWPRRRLLEQAARGLCKRLVERWMDKKLLPAVVASLGEFVQQQWDAHAMRPENLITRHQEGCERLLRHAPEKLFQDVVNPVQNALTPSGANPDTLNLGPVVAAMDALEKLLGIPDECRAPGAAAEPASLERTLSEVSTLVADQSEQKLTEMVVKLIEEPSYRLAGAEEALRELTAVAEKALQMQEQLCKELQDRAATLYQRIQHLLEQPALTTQPKTPSRWRIGLGRKSSPKQPNVAGEIVELLKAYPKCRYQSLILQQINRLYVSLRGHLSDQVREVGFCRHRLGELAGMLDPQPGGKEAKRKLPHEKVLLPGGCAKLDDAVRQVLDGVDREALLEFDRYAQELLRKEYRALVQVCMGPGHVLRTLTPALLRRGQQFISGRLSAQSVADIFFALDDHKDDQQACADDLADAYEKASPQMDRALRKSEIGIILVPQDAAGQKIDALLRHNLPSPNRIPVHRSDELVFFREVQNVPAANVEQLGPVAQEAYRQRLALDAATLHSREDVADWLPPVAAT